MDSLWSFRLSRFAVIGAGTTTIYAVLALAFSYSGMVATGASVLAFLITKRICLSLQRRDRDRVLHGSESGIIERDPSGTYSEAHVPVDHDEAFSLTQHKEYDMLEEGEEDADGNVISKRRARASRFMYGDDVAKPTAKEIEEAHEHGDHEVLDSEHDAPALPRH